MRNLLKQFFDLFKKECECHYDDSVKCCNPKDSEATELGEYPLSRKLNAEKEEAIKACDGCENEVYVLRLAGEDIGYYKSINQLCLANKFKNKTSVYRYWGNKQKLNPGEKAGLLFGKYEIVMLS